MYVYMGKEELASDIFFAYVYIFVAGKVYGKQLIISARMKQGISEKTIWYFIYLCQL